MKILCFGSCNIDLVYAVSHIIQPGETMSANALRSFPGGKGLNQSIALARAGAQVAFAGCIGQDGQKLYDTMDSCGIDLRYLRQVNEKTGHAIIQVDSNAENSIIIFSGANGMVTREHIDSVLQDFGQGDFLLVQNEISQLSYLTHTAARIGMQIVFNPSPFNKQAKQVDLQDIRYLIVNETEAYGMTDSEDPNALHTYIKEKAPHLKIVMTLGKKGSIYFDKDQVIRQSAYCVESVDTTAAGDTYLGYFIAGICRGDSCKTAMNYAAAASAIAVSREGAASSIPMRQEVTEALRVLQPYHTSAVSNQKKIASAFFTKNYADGTLSMLAKELGYSTTYTGAWLKENMGASFTELLHKKRCELCTVYLETTKLPISEIIHLIGYKNESFFRHKFREEYGCTPLAYRKRKEKSYENS